MIYPTITQEIYARLKDMGVLDVKGSVVVEDIKYLPIRITVGDLPESIREIRLSQFVVQKSGPQITFREAALKIQDLSKSAEGISWFNDSVGIASRGRASNPVTESPREQQAIAKFMNEIVLEWIKELDRRGFRYNAPAPAGSEG